MTRPASLRPPTVLLTVVAVVVVLAGAVILGRPGGGGSAARDSLPAPPAGSRWVGAAGVVVAVPDGWTTGETRCLAPVEDTVYFDPAAQADCSDPADPATVREVSALAVLDGTCCYGEWRRRSMQRVDGSRAVELPGCERWFAGVCRRLFALPGTDVVFAVTIAEEGDGSYEAIRDSVRELPAGRTAVPLRMGSGFTPGYGTEPSLVDDVRASIERAGLRVEVDEVPRDRAGDAGVTADLPPGSLLGVSPSPGSVVADGATVRLTVAR